MGIEPGLSHDRQPTVTPAPGSNITGAAEPPPAPANPSAPSGAGSPNERAAVDSTESIGPSTRSVAPASERRAIVLLAVPLVFMLALATRAIGLGGAVTEDEDQWIARSGAFAQGLTTSEWQRTYQTGHPGVTVMWLTTLTLGLERTAAFARAAGAPDVTTVPDFLPALQAARLPFALLQAGLAAAAAVLAGRLLGAGVGLLAGLLLAAEPFWAGVGPVVGMDGLLTGLLTVSLLAALLAARSATAARGRAGWAALSGLAFGLAFLTKTTALFAAPLLVALFAAPLVGALALLAGWPGRRWPGRRCWRDPLLVLAGWGTAAALTVWLVWPAAWAAPVGTVVRAVEFSARLGGSPHGPGNFLLGQPVADPGPLFYPVALALRLGPGTVVGLLLLFVLGASPPARRTVWALLGSVALFLVLLTVAAKKVDRYLLPILPALGILAAVGWWEAGRWTAGRLARRGALLMGGAGPLAVAAALALALQLWPLLQAGRYPLAAYDPLFGGVRAAERAIPVGWGDGLDVAGARIAELARGRTVTTAIWSPLRVSFGAHAPGPVVSERQIGQADFYVDYVHARQRGLTPRTLAGRQPDAVVTIGGVDYARIYRLRR